MSLVCFMTRWLTSVLYRGCLHHTFHRAPMTVVNIFRYTASVDALIWASALASLIAMVMYFVQCILSLREFMEVSAHSTFELTQLTGPSHQREKLCDVT